MSKARIAALTLCSTLMVTAALATVTATPASATNSPYSSKVCTDIIILGVRGSGQEPKETNLTKSASAGPQVKAAADRFVTYLRYKKSKKSVRFLNIPYDAVSVSKAALSGGSKYRTSLKSGQYRLKQMMTNLKKCTSSKFLLIGYSQGAQVVANSLRMGSLALSASEQKRVLAAVSISDPTRYKANKVRFYGFNLSESKFRSYGVLATSAAKMTTTNRYKSLTICDIGDKVCNGSVQTLSAGKGTHTKAYLSSAQASLEANAIHKMLKANKFKY